jgi:hypothetical protein
MTQTTQHTPGPWQLVPTVHSDRLIIFGAAPAKEYCIGTLISGSRVELPTLRANARLIAAAPELLEVLEFIAADIEEGINAKGAWRKLAHDAIAKAKGGAA